MGLFDEIKSALEQVGAAGAGRARAVVVSVGESAPDPATGRVTVPAVLELTGVWADHVRAPFDLSLSAEGAARLAPGLEVPVQVDAETGDLTGLDVAGFESETRGGAPGPVSEPPPKMPGTGVIPEPPAFDDDGLPVMDASDPALAPIEGVTLEAAAAAMVSMGQSTVPAAVQQAWMARATSDWRVGARLGAAAQAARKAAS